MSTKVSTGFGWLEDDVTGDPAGVRRHSDGKEFGILLVETDKVTGGVEVPFVVKGKSAAALAATPSADDIALGDSTLFYNIADPTKRYTMNSARSAFVLVADGRVEPYILSQSSVPVILLPSGAVNASGQFTLTTALPYVPSGTVKVYVFAGVGLAAGLYPATFSSTTVCQLVGNPTTTAGSYSGGTGEVTIATVTVPGGEMRSSGSIRATCAANVVNNANTKTIRGRLAGFAYNGTFASATTAGGCAFFGLIKNRGASSSQVSVSIGNSAYAPIYTSIDTSVDQLFSFSAQVSVATDYVILEAYTVEILPGA